MKNLLFLLVFCAISAHSQTGSTIVTAEGRGVTDFIIYDHETTPRWNISGVSIKNALHVGETENKKEIESIEINQGGDTLTIYRKWFLYTSPGGPGTTCLVMGCNSDHKAHFRDRLIFFERSGELEFVRREVGELKTVETTTQSTKWVYRK